MNATDNDHWYFCVVCDNSIVIARVFLHERIADKAEGFDLGQWDSFSYIKNIIVLV